ncbi:fibronectin type III domain-containing protein [Dorea sp. AF24-7LB]|uniref:fibronectin type III domain-containing protein n=1 Tax=Dorea sp. AF24-7LB TaxID=2293097 RepID=UPI000E4EE17D|nr:fibronectin type III domain-containing protein [Dorea sp. AF24-7LB]RHQ55298.1 fibronectin type III domain-containing protein [Dorea sp. AF24-7LB]
MKKRFAKLAAILLSSAMTLTMIPTNFVYAKDVDTTAVQTEATDDQQDESGKITIPDTAESATDKKAETVTEDKDQKDQKDDAKVENKSADKKAAKSKAVEKTTVKKQAKAADDAKDPVKVTIPSVPVNYTDGKPVENGHVIEVSFAGESSYPDTYTVKNGKIYNVELLANEQYKFGISPDDDEDFWADYELAYAQDGFVRAGVDENSKTLFYYDTTNNKVTRTPIRQLLVKKYGADDSKPEKVTIPSLQVTYADGKPVEDGHVFAFYNTDDAANDTVSYTTKDGKLSNLKLEAGVPYKVSIDDYEDEDFWTDYELAYAQDGFVRVAATQNSKTLLHYDNETETITKTPVRKLTVKEYGAKDPVKVPYNKDVNVADIDVVYEDGTPVEDGMTFDLINMQTLLDSSNYSTRYTTKDGKLSGVKMKAEVQYKLGFDVNNKYWQTHNIVGAYKSDKLMRIYARYDNQAPLYYDYDEGIDADEQVCSKIVVKKLDKPQDPGCVIPASCWMSLLLSDNGYYAEGGLSFKMTRLDTNKSKTVLSREGEVVVTGESYTDYLLTLDENDTYEIDFDSNPLFKQYKELGGIPFQFQQDKAGKTQAVLKGYDVEDITGRLNYNYLDLKRIDGKQNTTGKKFSDDECGDSTEVKTLYAADKVTLKDMKVNEYNESTEKATPLDKDITFVFYNCSTQTIETTVKSHNGVLPDVEMFKDHHYIVYAEDSEYEMPNHYITLAKTGDKPLCYKCNENESSFDLTKRQTELADPSDAARVNVSLPVYYVDEDGNMKNMSDIKVKLVSPYDTVEGTSDAEGNLNVSLMEDYNYMVQVDNDKYSVESFPLTVKDKSEYGAGKYTFNHFSCGSVGGIYLVDKGTEHDRDVTLIGTSELTSVTGLNFGKGSYYLHDRVLEDYKVPELEGKDYQVLDIDALNMYRTEISKLAAGDFVITRILPKGKSVKNVYYIDKDNKLQKLDFTESNGTVTFKMGSLSIYNNVIEYKSGDESDPTPDNKKTAVKASQVSLSKVKYTYTGKSVKPAVKAVVGGKKLKAGTDYKVSYSDNKNVGKAKAVVTFKGKYTGKITKSFVINPKGTSLKSVKRAKKAFKATWKKQSKQTTGYQIQYSTKKGFGSKVKTVTVSKNKVTSKTIKSLKKNQKYYVRVRTYKKAGNSKFYSGWSKTKSVKTK